MNADDIKTLRQELRCTARELATTLGLEQATVLAWERGELFPTKKHVDRMRSLAVEGPSAIVRKKKIASNKPMDGLGDPDVWALLRKLCAHAELRKAALKLGEGYPDPLDES